MNTQEVKLTHNSFMNVYNKLMSEEISVEHAKAACSALTGANRSKAIQIKLAEMKKRYDIDLPSLIEDTEVVEAMVGGNGGKKRGRPVRIKAKIKS